MVERALEDILEGLISESDMLPLIEIISRKEYDSQTKKREKDTRKSNIIAKTEAETGTEYRKMLEEITRKRNLSLYTIASTIVITATYLIANN